MKIRAHLSLYLADFKDRACPFRLTFRYLTTLTNYLFFLLRTLDFLFRPAKMIPLPKSTLTAIRFGGPTYRVIGRVAIIHRNGRHALMLLRILFRPISEFNVGIIDKLIRRGRVKLLRR